MEVISFHVSVISRATGKSAVQTAAYCSRSKIHSDYTGETYDYRKRKDLVYHKILLPRHAPDTFYDSETLWNSVEMIEKNRNAQLVRTIVIALPQELNHETHIAMVQQYVQKCFVQCGMCADVSIHDKGEGNPHAHILLTTRSLDNDGKWMSKQHRNYLLDENGNRIFDPIKRQYKLGKSIKINDWDNHNHIEEWRKNWADVCNVQFQQYGIDKEVTHLSYVRQGIEREPTKHLGPKVKALEERGLITDRGEENRAIQARNKEKEREQFRQRLKRSQNQNRDRDYERER